MILPATPLERSAMRSSCCLIPAAAIALSQPSLAQRLMDPNSVAPDFRAAAEKRRAEQVKLVDCQEADEAKLPAGPGGARQPLSGSCGRQVGKWAFDPITNSVRRP
jgi:hypothetical protein